MFEAVPLPTEAELQRALEAAPDIQQAWAVSERKAELDWRRHARTRDDRAVREWIEARWNEIPEYFRRLPREALRQCAIRPAAD